MLFKWIRYIFLGGHDLIHSYFAWMLPMSRHPERYPLEYRYATARRLILHMMEIFRLEFRLEHYETLKEVQAKGGPYLLVGNHQATGDPLLLIALSDEPIVFLAKKETKRMPFVGRVLRAIDGVFIDRKCLRSSVDSIAKLTKEMDEAGAVIYPEGHRQSNMRADMFPFHGGSFKPAYLKKATVVLFAEFGTKRLLSGRQYRSNLLQIDFLPPREYPSFQSLKTVELAAITHQEVQDRVRLMRDEDDAYFALKKQRRKPENPNWEERYGIPSSKELSRKVKAMKKAWRQERKSKKKAA